MTDEELVKRLRRADEYEPLGHDGWEAADRIEALTAENERLERVVKDISDEADLAEQEACMVENDFIKAEKEIEALTAKLAQATWLLTEAAVQLEEGKIKTRRNRAAIIWNLLDEMKDDNAA
jgi:hypothetical protein